MTSADHLEPTQEQQRITGMWHRDAASKTLGMELLDAAPGSATIAMTVRTDMVNGWSVCHGGFIATLADSAFAVACNYGEHIATSVASSVSLSSVDDGSFRIDATLAVTIPGVTDPAVAVNLAREAHRVCPYSAAIRGNVEVRLTANGQWVAGPA